MDPRNRPLPEKPTSLIDDGYLTWPASEGRVIRINPFFILAYGMAPAKAMRDGRETPVFLTWVDTGGQNGMYQTAWDTKPEAEADLRRIQAKCLRN